MIRLWNTSQLVNELKARCPGLGLGAHQALAKGLRAASFWQIGNHFGTLAFSCGTIEAAERTRGVLESDSDFGVILGPMYISFLISRSLIFVFSGWFPGHAFYRFLDRNVDAREFQIEVFARMVSQKTIFLEFFLVSLGIDFCCFWVVSGAVFLVFCVLKTSFKDF